MARSFLCRKPYDPGKKDHNLSVDVVLHVNISWFFHDLILLSGVFGRVANVVANIDLFFAAVEAGGRVGHRGRFLFSRGVDSANVLYHTPSAPPTPSGQLEVPLPLPYGMLCGTKTLLAFTSLSLETWGGCRGRF